MKLKDPIDGSMKSYSEAEAAELIHALRERNKELHLLHELAVLGSDLNLSLEEVLQRFVGIIPAAWQYPEDTCVKIVVGKTEVSTANFRSTEWKQSAFIDINGEDDVGVVEVCYLSQKPERDEGPFLKEERSLIHSLARHTADIVERRRMVHLLQCRNRQLEATNVQLIAAEKRELHRNAELRESEERYRFLVEKSSDLIWRLRTDGVFTYVSPSWKALLGYKPSFMEDEAFQSFVHPDDVTKCENYMSRVLKAGEALPGPQYRVKHADGTWRWHEGNITPVFDEEGAFLYFVGVSRDITERKLAEERCKILFDSSADALMTLEPPSWRFTSCNPATIKLFGTRDEADFVCRPPWEYSPNTQPDGSASADKAREMIETAMERGSNLFEWQHITLKGREFPAAVLLTRVELGGRPFLQATVRDITERKLAEETLKRRLLYESVVADITTLAVNVEDTDLFQNQCVAMLGERTNVSRVYIFDYNHDDKVMNNTHEWCGEGVAPQMDELQGLPGDVFAWWMDTLLKGEVLCYSDINEIPDEAAREILTPQGVRSILVVPLFVRSEFFGFIGFDECKEHRDWPVEDIAILTSISRILTTVIERKQAEEMIKSERDRLRAVMDTAPVAILLADSNECIVQINRTAESIFGQADFSGEEPQRCGEVICCVHRNDSPDGCGHGEACSSCDLCRSIKEGLAGKTVDSLETEIKVESDGKTTRRRILLSVAPFPFADQPGVIVAANDITEIQELHAKIAQSDRLSSMGMLAAGVAHEIKNPLSYSLYNLESLTDELPELLKDLSRVHAFLNEPDKLTPEEADILAQKISPTKLDDVLSRFRDALNGTKRIQGITRGLSTFSRVERDTLIHVDLVNVIEVAINMAYNEIKYRARLVKEYNRIPMVLASEGRLSQVFLNLLINATHAIGEGDVENNEIRVKTWSDDNFVYAEVSDTGSGIDRETQEKLFEPFFSTKDIGKGSGLGLTISKTIIESYGGAISVESEKGKGTSFILQLPVSEEKVEIEKVPRPAATGEHVRGRILIVDDEARIRSSMVRMLRDHDTVEAESGAAAMQLLKEDNTFDLILCDMMMPDVSGMDFHQWLVENHPVLANGLIFITGGAFTPRARDYLAKVDNLRLEKPFSMENFKNLVNERIRFVKSSMP